MCHGIAVFGRKEDENRHGIMFNELITGEHGDFSIKPVYGSIECTDENFGVADPDFRHRCWCVGTVEQ